MDIVGQNSCVGTGSSGLALGTLHRESNFNPFPTPTPLSVYVSKGRTCVTCLICVIPANWVSTRLDASLFAYTYLIFVNSR